MRDKPNTLQIKPYDLPAVRRSASGAALKPAAPIRQPYLLAASQRFSNTTVLLRGKNSD